MSQLWLLETYIDNELRNILSLITLKLDDLLKYQSPYTSMPLCVKRDKNFLSLLLQKKSIMLVADFYMAFQWSMSNQIQ